MSRLPTPWFCRSSADACESSASAPKSSWWTLARLAVVPIAALLISGTYSASSAEPGGLSGSWRGSGWVTLSSGKRERARCTASYSPSSANSYTLKALCATSSAKATQTATLTEVSKNRFRGSFYNPEFDVRGTIRVVLKGRSQSVTLKGNGATANIQMRR